MENTINEFVEPIMRPEMPDHGVYLHWPEQGTDWIHPDDVELANRCLPSDRVWKRSKFDGTYYHLAYGEFQLRVKPTMWLLVRDEGFELGDQVEILENMGKNSPGIGRIEEIRYDQEVGHCYYLVHRREFTLPSRYHADDLSRLTTRPQLQNSTTQHPQPQQSDLFRDDSSKLLLD